jgi:splicing suppressor protein 51
MYSGILIDLDDPYTYTSIPTIILVHIMRPYTRILARRALVASTRQPILSKPQAVPTRPFFSFFRRDPKPSTAFKAPVEPQLLPNDLFHPLSHSPFPALVEKADRIKAASLCPVSYERYGERVRPGFDCPDCGFPTHRDQQRWTEGRAEHAEFCGRLREVNEDEHDIRSGRKLGEFENMPG